MSENDDGSIQAIEIKYRHAEGNDLDSVGLHDRA